MTKKTQKEKFIQAAKALECDESEEAFNKKLKAVATSEGVKEKRTGSDRS